MSDWRPLTDNKEAGIRSWIDMDTGTIRHQQTVDVPLLQAKADRQVNFDARRGRQSTQDHMHKVADIPVIIYEQLKVEGITEDPARFSAWLNDPDNAAWRSDERRIGVMNGNRRHV